MKESMSQQDWSGRSTRGFASVTLAFHSPHLFQADRNAMNHILEAIRTIKAYSAELAKKA